MQSARHIFSTCNVFPTHGNAQFKLIGLSIFTPIFCRNVHMTKQLSNNAHRKTRLELMCELNERLYIHRNSEFGPQPIFYRGNRRVDLYQRYLDKLQKKKDDMTFRPEKEAVLEKPVDDVFLTTLYKPKIYSIKEAVETLKEYVRLDLTDTSSVINLKLGLQEITSGKGKRKKSMMFVHTTKLPHPWGGTNKLAYFTTDDIKIEQAKEAGVYAVGSEELIVKILNNVVQCDLFFTTPEYLNVLISQSDLRRKLGKLIPSRQFGVVADVAELTPFMEETIYHNRHQATTCEVKIGRANQDSSQLEDNLRHVLHLVHDLAEESKVDEIVTSAEISCHTEPIPIDIGYLRHDDV